jgi:hypothetical protein
MKPMSEPVPVHVRLSDEIAELLVNHQIDLVEYLKQQDISAKETFAENPVKSSDTPNEKELATVILVSAGGVALVTLAVTRLIETLQHRPVLVKQKVVKPVEDAAGKVIRGADGSPLLQWVEVAEFVEPRPRPHGTDSFSASCYGIELSYKSERGESAR